MTDRLTDLRRYLQRNHAEIHARLRDYPGVDQMWTDDMRRRYLDAMEEANRIESESVTVHIDGRLKSDDWEWLLREIAKNLKDRP